MQRQIGRGRIQILELKLRLEEKAEKNDVSIHNPIVSKVSLLKIMVHGKSPTLLSLTPLSPTDKMFSFSVVGKINGKDASMIIDTGCSRSLIDKKYIDGKLEPLFNTTVLTATGERIVVPLLHVEIVSKRGKCKELVGGMDNLLVDFLQGCSMVIH